MKRILAVFVVLAVMISGCAPSTYRDDQIYIVNKGRHSAEKDELLNWLSVEGPQPFREPEWPAEELNYGDVPLYYDAERDVFWILENKEPQKMIEKSVLFGEVSRDVRLVAWHLADNERRLILEPLPFVSKVLYDEAAKRLFLYGGKSLVRVDLKREKAVVEVAAMKVGALEDIFLSPLETRKLFLSVAGLSGGALYYPDTSRSVSLYETGDRLYYKALLEKPYYYAAEWRSPGDDQPENLWTVIADGRDQVVRTLGQGDFIAGYEKKVLIRDSSGFGLSLVKDINVPEGMVQICDEYVYDAGFSAGGELYWIGDGKEDDEDFLLHLLDINGKERLSVPVSGSEILLDESGRKAYGSGQRAEEIDLSNGHILHQREVYNPLASLDAALLATMMLTVSQYGRYLLNDRTALESLYDITPDPSVCEAMRELEIEKGDPYRGKIHLSAQVELSYFAHFSNSVEFTFNVLALSEQGRIAQRTLDVRYYKNGDLWKIESFSAK